MLDRNLLCACWLIALSCQVACGLESRSWTNNKQQTFEGKLIEVAGNDAVIERNDGKRFHVAIATLSEADRQYVAKSAPPADARGQATAVPPAHGGAPVPAAVRSMLAGYDGSNPNFGSPWPTVVKCEDKVEITVISENDSAKEFIYESPHFRFQSNAVMRKSLISKIALLFEAAFEWHKSVPLNNRRTRSKDAPKLKAMLFETKEQYHQGGGPPGTAGVYMPGKDTFLVPFAEVGAKKIGSGYMYDFNGDPHTMLHELTHQLWADTLDGGTWFVEGFAEYMSSVPYRGGSFSYSGHARAIKEYALAYGKKNKGGRALGDHITMPHLEKLMGFSQPEFYAGQSRNYGLGLLLVTYFIDMDGNKDSAVFKNAIRAMQEGKSAAEINKVFLNGRSYADLEHDFAKAWRGGGATIEFQ